MNSNWHDSLGACGACFDGTAGNEIVAGFGDTPAELNAARTATVVAPLTLAASVMTLYSMCEYVWQNRSVLGGAK